MVRKSLCGAKRRSALHGPSDSSGQKLEDLDERVQRLPRMRRPPRSWSFRRPGRRIKTVALIGPPNSGKTTLFNRLTGLRQKVANFPGVTVEQHTGMAELPDGRVDPASSICRASTASRRARKTSRSRTTC